MIELIDVAKSFGSTQVLEPTTGDHIPAVCTFSQLAARGAHLIYPFLKAREDEWLVSEFITQCVEVVAHFDKADKKPDNNLRVGLIHNEFPKRLTFLVPINNVADRNSS